MKDILKEFDEKILSDVGMNTLEIRSFLSETIDKVQAQTREETIRECIDNLPKTDKLNIISSVWIKLIEERLNKLKK